MRAYFFLIAGKLRKRNLWEGRACKVLLLRKGGGAQKVLPCLEGEGAQKVSDPRFSHIVPPSP